MTPKPRDAAEDAPKTGRIVHKEVKRGRVPKSPEPSPPVSVPRVIHPRRPKPALPPGDDVDDSTPSPPAPLDDAPPARTRKPKS